MAEVEERNADPRMSYDDFRSLEKRDPARAAQVLSEGGVILPAHIEEVLHANRDERARLLGNSFDSQSPIQVPDYEAALAERARRDSGWPGAA